jgi:hypothetical protein
VPGGHQLIRLYEAKPTLGFEPGTPSLRGFSGDYGCLRLIVVSAC